jgi:hypothetical protein
MVVKLTAVTDAATAGFQHWKEHADYESGDDFESHGIPCQNPER